MNTANFVIKLLCKIFFDIEKFSRYEKAKNCFTYKG